MNEQNVVKAPSREEFMAAIKDCAAKLGRVPSFEELKRSTGLGRPALKRHFANYTKALRACGLEAEGTGYRVPQEKLFADYAAIVRALGEVPTVAEYELRSKYTRHPLITRFGFWGNVPTGMLQHAEQEGLGDGWDDVLEVLRKHCQGKQAKNGTCASTLSSTSKPKILGDRPVYGDSLLTAPMVHAPVNEMGVVYLFGVLANKLRFSVLWMGTEFPDCEALREVFPGRWQRVRIEFEFQSRNFLAHMHDPAGCDLIVCWEHNWPDCPLDAVELKIAL